MKPKKQWNVLQTEVIQKGRFGIIYETVQFTPEKIGPYSYVRYRADGICVLPVLPDGRVCLVRQYRRPVDKDQIEVPAGMIDKGELSLACAQRELLEETGLQAKRIINCSYIYASPGSSTETMHLFIAFCENEQIDQKLDESESIEVNFYTMNEVKALIKQGIIHHAPTLLLFQHLLELLKQDNERNQE